ncbi:MAG TPA: transcriptional regulator, partial [Rugosimonospora sp.]
HNVLEAIAADPDLTAAQKQSLIQIYETFRRENAREAEASAAQAPAAQVPASQVPAGEPGTGADAGTDSVVDDAPGDAPADPSGAGATGPADQADGPTATVPEQHPKPATNAARKAATTKEI